MQFIGGGSQQEYVERTRGLDPSRCLAAGIDVGKYEALCLIADHRGEVVGEALTFPLTEPGVRALEAVLAVAARSRGSASLRIGVETAGHYHRTVVARLVAAGHDVVELNPAHVKAARAQQGSRRLPGGGTASSAVSFPPCSGEAGAVSSKWSQLGADALSHARGVSWFPSWVPPYVRSPMPLPGGPPTPLRCITRPWTRMRPGQVNARRYTCRPAGCAPCHTAMQGHASSSPPKRRPPRWLTAGRRPQGTDRTAVGGVGARERPTESSNPTAVPTGRIRRKVDAVTTDPTSPRPKSPKQSPPVNATTPGQRAPRLTRASAVWAATAAAIMLLVLLIIFMMQNSTGVEVHYLGFAGSLPLGLALLIAAVGGGLAVAIAGVARVTQLRLNARRARQNTPPPEVASEDRP
jgi:uncharacterized integral membrane protein